MGFKLSQRSQKELAGVHPDLVALVESAASISDQEFLVVDGVRTPEEQAVLVAKGASKTLKSKHLIQADGFCHAVDLVPLIGGNPRWEWPLIYPIASAMRRALEVMPLQLRWGGVWDRRLNDLAASPAGLEDEVEAYAARVRSEGRKPFLDGPHYELAS